jgi:hypothetical protein
VLYAGSSGYGVFRSEDAGAHWSTFNDGLPNLDVRLLTVASNALYAVTPKWYLPSDPLGPDAYSLMPAAV